MLLHATVQDADAVATVLIESRRAFLPFARSPYPDVAVRRWVQATLLPQGRTMLWRERDVVTGMLSTSEDARGSWIDQLYLLPGHTGRGIGSILLSHAHSSLERPIWLYTFQQNAGARRFYERAGYEPVEFTDGHGNEERCPDVLYRLKRIEA